VNPEFKATLLVMHAIDPPKAPELADERVAELVKLAQDMHPSNMNSDLPLLLRMAYRQGHIDALRFALESTRKRL
jgi:hypothetical protein